MKAVRVVIHGRVQGVWFRAWTVEAATRAGLDGWVRNRRDGTVEALFAGHNADVDAMVLACRQGPKAARVTDVEKFPAELPESHGFGQRPTE